MKYTKQLSFIYFVYFRFSYIHSFISVSVNKPVPHPAWFILTHTHKEATKKNDKNMVKNRIFWIAVSQKLAKGVGDMKLLLACLFLTDWISS